MKNIMEEVASILETDYTSTIEKANTKQLYNALSKSLMKNVVDDWDKTRDDLGKRVGYFSAEFLIGRLLYANMLNMGVMKEVRDAFASKGLDLNMFEEVEDAALGNGGLGRLAACYLDSAASTNVRLDGYGIRYRFGLFKQTFDNGFQHEEGDDWLKWGDPWSIRMDDEQVIVKFKDLDIKAVPYDIPVIGYQNHFVNTLRLWQSEPVSDFDFKTFDDMKGAETAIKNHHVTEITSVLYPNDNTKQGKLLRLKQQYFLASASIQDVLRKFKKTGKNFAQLDAFISVQLNDTHPVVAIPELIRLLRLEGLSFDEAFELCEKVFNFTNHTILGEALEKWNVEFFEELIPEVYEQVLLIQERIEKELKNKDVYFVIKKDQIHMANLAIYTCAKVNGVAAIHTAILKNDTFKDWYKVYPQKFVNVTNGITPRRWLVLNNQRQTRAISDLIGDSWITHLDELSKIKEYANDKNFIENFKLIKQENKDILAKTILNQERINVPSHFIFDTQVKRFHEYKRQLLNAFSILYFYFGLKDGSIKEFKPTAFIIGGKAAPGYYAAKAVIKFINEIAKLINNDPEISDKMKVVFVHNYNVSYAEKIVCASDFSEQISMAGMEASGTGNMKFMLNGTPTVGTLDGANIEICEEAGRENNYIFGATVDEVKSVKSSYNPKALYKKNAKLRRIVDTLVDGTFSDSGVGIFKNLFDSLLEGNEPDRYLVLYDFNSYVEEKLRAINSYGTDEYFTKCIINMASAGKFSSDRSISEYCKLIWNI